MSDQPSKPGAVDPSMDDILASIRKILREDGAEETPEPLVLTEEMMVEAPPPAAPPPAAPPPAAVETPAAAPEAPSFAVLEALSAAPEAPMPAPQPADALLAPTAAAAAAAALGQLSRAVAQDRTAPVMRSGGPSIEDVVREELRPILKAWLDDHLPGIVERLVKAEIERVMAQGR